MRTGREMRHLANTCGTCRVHRGRPSARRRSSNRRTTLSPWTVGTVDTCRSSSRWSSSLTRIRPSRGRRRSAMSSSARSFTRDTTACCNWRGGSWRGDGASPCRRGSEPRGRCGLLRDGCRSRRHRMRRARAGSRSARPAADSRDREHLLRRFHRPWPRHAPTRSIGLWSRVRRSINCSTSAAEASSARTGRLYTVAISSRASSSRGRERSLRRACHLHRSAAGTRDGAAGSRGRGRSRGAWQRVVGGRHARREWQSSCRTPRFRTTRGGRITSLRAARGESSTPSVALHLLLVSVGVAQQWERDGETI